MKPNFRTCPQCSTRNRLDKEFCVKCGEPLEGVKAGDPTAAAAPGAKKGKPGIVVLRDGEEGQSPLVPFILVLLTLGVAFGAWRVIQEAEANPNTAQAAPPMRQASVPPVVAVEKPAGQDAYLAGMAALRAGDFPNALRLLREAVAAAPAKPEFRLGLAEALEKSGATSEALLEYEATAGLDQSTARYTAEWAKALNRAGRNPDAVRAYEAALQLEPDNLANLRELAGLHLRSEDFASARPHLERIVALQPDDLTPKQNLARALEATRDLDGAARQYREILAAMPSADLSRALLSDVLMRQNRPSEALTLLDEGLAANAASPVLHREKGRIYDRLGRVPEAISAYREYVRLSPGATDIRVFTERIGQLAGSAAR